MGEIAENCQGVKLVLVALKCDLRALSDDHENTVDTDDSQPRKEPDMIDYKEGLEVARRIQALRYLGTSNHLLLQYIKSPAADISCRVLCETKPRCE